MTATLTRPIAFDRPLTARERQIIEDITRREFIIGGTALTVLIAASCSSDEDADGDAATTDETRLFTDDADATVEVPVSPKRVAFLGYETLVTAVWLGHVPAALAWHTPDTDPVSYLQEQFGAPDELAGVTELGDVFAVNVEAVAEVAPDLIVAETWMEPAVYDQLRQIAPVVRFNFRAADPLVPQAAMALAGHRGGVRRQGRRIRAAARGVA
jgi:ABC-type Fe3+-hydroxamate transport system substrate-binding protein